MKYAILGDIHGNLEALEAVLAACRELGVEKYACIGDIVGYNANPKECLNLPPITDRVISDSMETT